MSISASGVISVRTRSPDGSVNTVNPCSGRIDVAEPRPANATSCPATDAARARGTIGFAWPSPPANERPQEVQHPPEQLVGETRADLPDPAELALQIGPYEQRPERARSSALSGRPAEDHAVLPVQQLDLPPVRRAPALEIPRPQLLRDDALELELASRLGELQTPAVH